jgi:hypothetical protein
VLSGLFLCASGCRATTPPPSAAETERAQIRDLEDRVVRLETRAKAADCVDEILALEVERAGLLVLYSPGHPTVAGVDRKIRAWKETEVVETRARREQMARRLEVEREGLLITYTPSHQSVRKLDAQIAFLRSDGR